MNRASTITQVVAVLVRHLPPLVGVFAYGWSVGQFLVCAVFGTTWLIGLVAATGVIVSLRQDKGATPTRAEQLGDLARIAVTALIAGLVLGALFGWIVVVVAMDGDARTFNRSLLIPLAMTMTAGLVSAFAQYRADLAARLDEATRKRRDQPMIFALLASAAIIWFVSAHFAQAGRYAALALAVVLTVLFVVCDLRPDFLRRILPLGGG